MESDDAEDYVFGLDEDDITEYTKQADILHALIMVMYGPTGLTSYMMKLIDYVPAFLRQSDIKSVMR